MGGERAADSKQLQTTNTEMHTADDGSTRDLPLPTIRIMPRWGLDLAPLPTLLTSFIGREQELTLLADLLQRNEISLISLTGAGGVGKTRLAIRAASQAAATFRDGVAFVSLAEIRDPALVLPAIARTLGLRAETNTDALDALAIALQRRHLLLVLDNLEQVRAAAPDLHALLAASPRLRILATTRQRLRLSGEVMVHVAPLPTPVDQAHPPLTHVFASDAVRLFVSRTRDANPHFSLTPDNAATVAEICRRLDGLPLAIELAAARGNVLPPVALLERLERDLPLLTGGPDDAPARQRTLHAAIAWSESLLTPEEQALFARLSVFRGGFTLTGAMAISMEDPTSAAMPAEEIALLDRWSPLVDQGLVIRQDPEADSDEPRFTMLETIAAYARVKLAQSGESEQIHRRHARYFRDMAATVAPELTGSRQKQWLDALERESANLRAALTWLISTGDAATSQDLSGHLFLFWLKRGHISEGRDWLARALALPGDVPARVHLNAVLADVGLAGPSLDITQANKVLALARSLEDSAAAGRALHTLGGLALAKQDSSGIDMLTEALELNRAAHDRPWEAMTLVLLGFSILNRLRDPQQAALMMQEAIEVSTAHGDVWAKAMAQNGMGAILRSTRRRSQAVAHFQESLELALELGDGIVLNEALVGLAGVLAEAHRPQDAARLFGAAEAIRETMGTSLRHLMAPDRYQQDVALSRSAAGDMAFDTAWAEGRSTAPAAVRQLVKTVLLPIAEPALPSTRAHAAPVVELTTRELEILSLLAENRTNAEVAQILFIGTRTVEFHVSNILGKLGVENRREAAALASRLGLI